MKEIRSGLKLFKSPMTQLVKEQFHPWAVSLFIYLSAVDSSASRLMGM